MATSTVKTHHIDASGKSLGRVATEAAYALMGKMSADYTPNVRSIVKVTVENAGKISMREKKQNSKTYVTYSGFPGGIKRETFSRLTARKGSQEAVRRAVLRMLPNNRLRNDRMKNLVVTD